MTPFPIDPRLAHKWLNLDAYWESRYTEPEALIQKTLRNLNNRHSELPPLPRRAEILEVRQKIRFLEETLRADQPRLDQEGEELRQQQRRYRARRNTLRNLGVAVRRGQNGILQAEQMEYFAQEEAALQTELSLHQQQRYALAERHCQFRRQQQELRNLRETYADRALYLPENPLTLPEVLKTTYYLLDDRRSYLRDGALEANAERTLTEELAAQMMTDLDKKNFPAARAKLNQLDQVCESLAKPRQTAEAKSQIALALFQMGEFDLALSYLKESLVGFRGSDPHAEAIVRWMMGYIQWDNPLTLPEAMVNWRKSWEMFASNTAERRSATHPRDAAQWYKVRAEEMERNLQFAIEHGRPPIVDERVRPLVLGNGASPDIGGAGVHPAPPSKNGSPKSSPAPAVGLPLAKNGASPEAGGATVHPRPPSKEASPQSPLAAAPPLAEGDLSTPPSKEVPSQSPSATTSLLVEGDLFQWVAVGETIRVVKIIESGTAPGVIIERQDGLDFPALGDLPAGKRNFIARVSFDAMLAGGEFVRFSPPVGFNHDSVGLTNEPLQEAWLRLLNLNVYTSIEAHPAGGLVNEQSPDSAEIDRVYLRGQPYHLINLRKSRVIPFNPADKFGFVRVKGASMDQAKPYPINEGDYVLLRVNPNPDNGQIVAAIFETNQAQETRATLKRKKADGLHSESSHPYTIVSLDEVKRFVGEVIAVAKLDQ